MSDQVLIFSPNPDLDPGVYVMGWKSTLKGTYDPNVPAFW